MATIPIDLKSTKEQFVQYLESRRRARATIVAYSKDIEQLTDFLGNLGKKAVADVSHDELDAFLKKLDSDNYTPKSVSRKINSIKTFFRFLKARSTWGARARWLKAWQAGRWIRPLIRGLAIRAQWHRGVG